VLATVRTIGFGTGSLMGSLMLQSLRSPFAPAAARKPPPSGYNEAVGGRSGELNPAWLTIPVSAIPANYANPPRLS